MIELYHPERFPLDCYTLPWLQRLLGDNWREILAHNESLSANYHPADPNADGHTYRIKDKQAMYALFNAGRFGNAGLNFDSPRQVFFYLEQNPDNRVAIRTFKVRGPFLPNLDALSFVAAIDRLRSEGFQLKDMQFSAMMPDNSQLRMQWFAVRTENYIDLDYNTTPGLTMREAQPNFKHAEGLYALGLLKRALGEPDYDDLQELWNVFPECVVEGSSYNVSVGNRRRRQTVIWEVRSY